MNMNINEITCIESFQQYKLLGSIEGRCRSLQPTVTHFYSVYVPYHL